MKYLCLAYYDVKKFEALKPAEIEAIVSKCRPYDEKLRATMKYVAGGSLADLKDRFVLRPKRGQPSITDGPFAETKEQVGGMFIIEADSRDEAIRVASLHPAAHMNEELGWAVEVLPVETFSFDELRCKLDTAEKA